MNKYLNKDYWYWWYYDIKHLPESLPLFYPYWLLKIRRNLSLWFSSKVKCYCDSWPKHCGSSDLKHFLWLTRK